MGMAARTEDAVDRRPFTIPLFPLRTVLFPGGILPLKVFEQRYIDMTKQCLAEERSFGVCLITRGNEVARPGIGPAEFANVGTLAKIAHWDMPQLGIFHISTIGQIRFEIRSHATDAAGLAVAEVRRIPPEPSEPLPEAYAPLAKLLELIAARIGADNLPAEKRYDDASWVGYRLAELLPLPLTIKQSMLEINDARLRLHSLDEFLKSQKVL